MTVYAIRHSDSGALLGDRVQVADRPWTRMRGLIGRPELSEGEGLMLSPCQAVHMYGVGFAIDVLFLDDTYAVVAMYEDLKPGTRTSTHRDARYAVKFPAGTLSKSGLKVGDRVQLDEVDGVESVH